MARIELKPLTKVSERRYRVECRVGFGNGFMVIPTYENIINIVNFGWNMTFGQRGEHRHQRSGGTIERENLAIFKDVINGKFGELAFYKYCEGQVSNITTIDLECYGLGKWDRSDFEVTFNSHTYSIAIKTTKFFGNLLLLETKDWQIKEGKSCYIPNGANGFYDFIVFCRVQSNLEQIVQEVEKNGNDSSDLVQQILGKLTVKTEVVGHINNYDLVSAITNEHRINKGDYLVGSKQDTKMDADNYYIQSGCMRKMKRTG